MPLPVGGDEGGDACSVRQLTETLLDDGSVRSRFLAYVRTPAFALRVEAGAVEVQ